MYNKLLKKFASIRYVPSLFYFIFIFLKLAFQSSVLYFCSYESMFSKRNCFIWLFQSNQQLLCNVQLNRICKLSVLYNTRKYTDAVHPPPPPPKFSMEKLFREIPSMVKSLFGQKVTCFKIEDPVREVSLGSLLSEVASYFLPPFPVKLQIIWWKRRGFSLLLKKMTYQPEVHSLCRFMSFCNQTRFMQCLEYT